MKKPSTSVWRVWQGEWRNNTQVGIKKNRQRSKLCQPGF